MESTSDNDRIISTTQRILVILIQVIVSVEVFDIDIVAKDEGDGDITNEQTGLVS